MRTTAPENFHEGIATKVTPQSRPDPTQPEATRTAPDQHEARELVAGHPPLVGTQKAVTPRILLISTLLIVFNCYWVIETEGIWHTNHASAMSLFWNTVFFLLLLVLFNLGLKKFVPKWQFSQGELITCYVMMTIATALAGHDSLQLGIPAVQGFPIWFQDQQPSLGWDKFTRFYPDHLMVKDIEILRPVYNGTGVRELYTLPHLLAWSVPVFWWCAFILALGSVMVCMNVLIRKQWMEAEKLSYPIVQLPIAMTENGGSVAFFRNRLFLLGIAIGLALNIWNGLATFYPALPLIAVRHDAPSNQLQPLFNDLGYPFNQIGSFPVPLYLFLIAMGYFLPLDLSFSLWFFFLLKMAMRVVAASIGVQPSLLSSFPYFTQQSFGAWLMISLTALWSARRHLKEVWDKIWDGDKSPIDDSREPMSYRAAAIGLVLGMAFIFFFCLKAGMTFYIVLWYFAFFFLLSIGITRVRAELGPPAHEMAGNLNGTAFLTLFAGSQAVGLQNLTMMSMFWWFSGRGYRTHLMPSQLEGMKMAESGGVSMRGMGFAMILALVLGGLASFWAGIHLQYGAGVNQMTNHNWGQFQQVNNYASTPAPPDLPGIAALGFGGLVTVSMMWARMRFIGFPFHPAGYAIALTFGGEYYWSCLLVAWIIKFCVLRYGGLELHKKVLPVMFGLILGEYAAGALWSLLSIFINSGKIINIKTYDFAPGFFGF